MLHKVPFAEEAETKFLPTCKRQRDQRIQLCNLYVIIK